MEWNWKCGVLLHTKREIHAPPSALWIYMHKIYSYFFKGCLGANINRGDCSRIEIWEYVASSEDRQASSGDTTSAEVFAAT